MIYIQSLLNHSSMLQFINDLIVGLIILIAGVILSYMMGKKKSLNASKRKDIIYTPLINELLTIQKTS